MDGARMPDPLRRYSLFYFWYYAGLGALTPYISRFMESLGHSGHVIGWVWSMWYGSRVIGPPVWTAVLARSRHPGWLLVFGSLLTLLACAGFTTFHGALGLCVTMALFGLAVNPLLPQFEAMTLAALGDRRDEYGRIRLWGSIGFLLVASSYGWLLDRLGDWSFPWLVLPLYVLALATALLHRHAVVPVAATDQRQAVHATPRASRQRAQAMAVKRLALGRTHRQVVVTLLVHAQRVRAQSIASRALHHAGSAPLEQAAARHAQAPHGAKDGAHGEPGFVRQP